MRVLVADDHDLVRESIGAILGAETFSDVSLAATLRDAIAQAKNNPGFDLVLLDLDMPGMNGLDGLTQMLSLVGSTPVALLSGTASPGIAARAIEIGAAGFIPKTLSTRSMIAATQFMMSGEVYAPPELVMHAQSPKTTLLSRRETQVLAGVCEGKSNKEIARDLDLQEVTVKLHVKTLSRKLGARNRTHAAMIARDRSLI